MTQFNTWDEAIEQALTAPAAPAHLVEKVFAKTTRRPSWLVRWRKVLAGSMAVLLVGIGVYAWHQESAPFNHAELVAYMSQTHSDEYATFLSDLELFEQEF